MHFDNDKRWVFFIESVIKIKISYECMKATLKALISLILF